MGHVERSVRGHRCVHVIVTAYEKTYKQQVADVTVSLKLIGDHVAAEVQYFAPWLSHFNLEPSQVGSSVASVGLLGYDLMHREYDPTKGYMVVVIATHVEDDKRWHNALFKRTRGHSAVNFKFAVLTALNDIAFRKLEKWHSLPSNVLFARLQQAHEADEEESSSAILVIGSEGGGKSTLINSLLNEDACEIFSEPVGREIHLEKYHWKNVPQQLRRRAEPRRKWLLIEVPGFGQQDVDTDDIYWMLEQNLSQTKLFAVIVTFFLPRARVMGDPMEVVSKLITKGFVGVGSEADKWKRIFLVGTHNDMAIDMHRDYFYNEAVPAFFAKAPSQTGPAFIASDFKDGRVMCRGLVDGLADLDATAMRLQFNQTDCFGNRAPNAELVAKWRKLAAATHRVQKATLQDLVQTEVFMPSGKKVQFEEDFQPYLFNFLQVHNQEVGKEDGRRDQLLVVIWRWKAESPYGTGPVQGLFQTWEKPQRFSRSYTKLQSLWLPDDDTTVEITSNSAEDHSVVLAHRQLVTSLWFGADSSAAAQWFECRQACKLRKVLQSSSSAVAPGGEIGLSDSPLDKSAMKSCCSLLQRLCNPLSS